MGTVFCSRTKEKILSEALGLLELRKEGFLPCEMLIGCPKIPASSQHGVGRWAVAGCRKLHAVAVFPQTHSKEHLSRGRHDAKHIDVSAISAFSKKQDVPS